MKYWPLIYINKLKDSTDYPGAVQLSLIPQGQMSTYHLLGSMSIKLEEVDELVASLKLKSLTPKEVNPGALPDPSNVAQAPSWLLSWR